AVIVLILRQVAIILLMLLAPLAIVAYVLPNTRRLYKMWWESFSKALLMFPLIVAFIAAGRVFSAIAFHQGGPVNGLIGFGAYFAPYFMIPLTFRLAGSSVGALGNFVQSRAQGSFSALAEKRKTKRGERLKAAQKGGLYGDDVIRKNPFTGKQFKNGRSLGKLLNTMGNYSLDIGDTGTQKLGDTRLGKPFFGRQGRKLKGSIAHDRLEQSQKMMQELDPHYWTGRAMSGRLNHFLDAVSKDEANPERQRLAGLFEKDYGIHDKDGKFTGKYRDINGEKDAWNMSRILATSDTQGAKIAAEELSEGSHVATALGTIKHGGSEETQRVDIGTIGLLAAAKAGRLEDYDVINSRNDAVESGKDFGGYADARMARLQAVGEGKRIEQSRGHMEEYFRDEHGHMMARSVYENPMSGSAQKSFVRMDSQHLAASKSETLDAIGETMVYAASEYEMDMGPDGKLQYRLDASGQQIPKTDPIALGRSQAAKSKIKYMAQYSLGDTDFGRKIRDIALRSGMKESDLSWGASGLNPEEMRRAAEAGAPPPEEPAP
ncbi:MAG TPA: hypothetical protein VII55_02235, partial [Candidatus Saccharimonadales bacterium]